MGLVKAKYQSPGEPGKRGFEDLDCYQLALELMVKAHEAAKRFPPEEKYDLVQQLRRASKAITANIAEGYGRFHYLDTLRFYSIARGSLNETISHLITAKALSYLDEEFFRELYTLGRDTERRLNGLMQYVREQKRGSDLRPSAIREELVEYDIDLDADIQSD